MRDVLNRIFLDKDLKLDAVLHVGAGTGSELELYRQLRADKVMLVEANPMLADRLRQKIRGSQNIEVTAAAVADVAGESRLWILNNPRESSLCRPEGLLRRYPNLKVTQTISLRTLTLDALIDRLAPAPDGANLLVLEMQGMELAALSTTASEKLQRFLWIAVRSSRERLYEHGAKHSDVDTHLRNCGFATLETSPSETESPLRDVLFRRDDAQIELTSLRTRAKEREGVIESLQRQLDEHSRIILKLRSEIQELTDACAAQSTLAQERLAQLEQVTKSHDQQAKLAADLAVQLQQLTTAKEQLAGQAAEGRKEIEQLARARDEQSRLAQERLAQLEQVTKSHDQQAKLAADLAVQLQQLTTAKEQLAGQVSRADRHIEELSRTTAEQKGLVAERQVHIERLVGERDEQMKLAVDRKMELERLFKARDEQASLAQTRETELAKQKHLLQEDRKRIAQLEAQLADMMMRQTLLNEEIVKAEGQIDVIKHVLLGESNA
jgi:FkbM family methyltransferase